jgi:pseudouridine-5'-phosphate glycosidase
MNQPFLRVAAEVEAALEAGKAVVALESTIITHGMPWPKNAEMARRVEAAVREEGAVPATIAVINGVLRIGLPEAEQRSLAQTTEAMKLSTADLAFALLQRRTGGTTVAATMIAARLAGIAVFATGGIGGVHRGAEKTFDISADLDELARTPVIVVSAGPKAILDIDKTLEVLESRGVPVVAYRSDAMPAFWSRDSGLPAPLRLDTPEAIARFFETRHALGIPGGLLVANPVPQAHAIPHAEMEAHIKAAEAEAKKKGLKGKTVTPFLLERLLTLTGGRSLATNMALVENNAKLAAQIARALVARVDR